MRGIDWIFGFLLIILALLYTFDAFQGSLRDDSIRELVKLEVSQQIDSQRIPTTINAKYVTVINGEELIVETEEDK